MQSNDSTEARDRGDNASSLGRLKDLDDFKVADGYPDIRGWDVKTRSGEQVGKVGDLIVDTNAMRVRYVDVEVDRSVAQLADKGLGDKQEQHTLLPIGSVQLDDSNDDVLVDGYTLAQLADLPRYSGEEITEEYEDSLRTGRGHTTAKANVASTANAAGTAANDDRYTHDDYDDQRLYRTRKNTTNDATEQRLTLAEEQLVVGKRQVSGGEAQLRKTVDTEHVQQSVPLTHEEVTVERRALSPDAIVEPPRIGEDEIRMTIMEEQLVVEKRMVPREEIIVRKKQITNQQTVGADLQKERLVTEGLDGSLGNTDNSGRRN